MVEVSSRKLETVWRKYLEYDAVIELVQMLRAVGVAVRTVCPRCGAEGSVSTLSHSGYTYLVIRHPDRSTHTVPRKQINSLMPDLCKVKKELEQILELYKKYEEGGIKFCTDAKR